MSFGQFLGDSLPSLSPALSLGKWAWIFCFVWYAPSPRYSVPVAHLPPPGKGAAGTPGGAGSASVLTGRQALEICPAVRQLLGPLEIHVEADPH